MRPEGVRAFAPGRVNLIGEHTDYNRGLSLPFAIRAGVTASARPIGGGEVEARALDLGEEDRFSLAGPAPATGWRALVRGSVAELQRLGLELPPARLELWGDLPPESGLGSSAAFCLAAALAMRGLSRAASPEGVELARVCSRVENEWAGARTGLLDQLASLCGRDGQAVRIDMRSLELRHVPLQLGGAALATLDSGVRRAVGASGYNERREECAAACRALGIASLREAGPPDLERLPETLRRRARHVIGENERVDAMVRALRRGDPHETGRLIDASHRSLRDDYEVSIPAVERTVERARQAGALGARMVGGGFGGRVLALFPEGIEPPPDAMVVRPAAGARLL